MQKNLKRAKTQPSLNSRAPHFLLLLWINHRCVLKHWNKSAQQQVVVFGVQTAAATSSADTESSVHHIFCSIFSNPKCVLLGKSIRRRVRCKFGECRALYILCCVVVNCFVQFCCLRLLIERVSIWFRRSRKWTWSSAWSRLCMTFAIVRVFVRLCFCCNVWNSCRNVQCRTRLQRWRSLGLGWSTRSTR